MRIEIWSDVVCPWCYVGKRRLETALAGFEHADEVEVVYRSFELDPTAPQHAVEPTLEALARKYGPDVAGVRADDERASTSRPRRPGSSSTSATPRTPAPSTRTGCCTSPSRPAARACSAS